MREVSMREVRSERLTEDSQRDSQSDRQHDVRNELFVLLLLFRSISLQSNMTYIQTCHSIGTLLESKSHGAYYSNYSVPCPAS